MDARKAFLNAGKDEEKETVTINIGDYTEYVMKGYPCNFAFGEGLRLSMYQSKASVVLTVT